MGWRIIIIYLKHFELRFMSWMEISLAVQFYSTHKKLSTPPLCCCSCSTPREREEKEENQSVEEEEDDGSSIKLGMKRNKGEARENVFYFSFCLPPTASKSANSMLNHQMKSCSAASERDLRSTPRV
jgi:hypothetical protein